MRTGTDRSHQAWAVAVVFLLMSAVAMVGPGASLALAVSTAAIDIGYGMDSPPYSGYNGGEFDVYVGSWDYAPWVTSVSHKAGDFGTFCLQTDQYYTPRSWGGPYYYVELSKKTDHKTTVDLHPYVAYLFDRWNSGTLAYDYGDTAQHRSDAAALQNLIWGIQKADLDPVHYSVQQQGWLAEAVGSGWTDTRDIWVMRLYSQWDSTTGKYSGDGQDQLVKLTPEPSSLCLLALGGLPILPLVRRRRR